MQDKQGQRVPKVTFRTRQNDEWKNITSDDVFAGRNVIVFSLPGAFTPTCSSSHLPRYNELAATFADQGIDQVVCVSVNDSFVMNAWKASQEAENILFLPDGNGEFTAAMGMLVDKQDLGFGQRSWRYSMLVRDGVIEKMFIEPDQPGDPFEVSDADTMLHYLDPQAQEPAPVSIFSRPGCSHCARAKALLNDHAVQFEEIVLGTDASSLSLRAITGRDSVPQVFIAGQHIGGADELAEYLSARQSLAA